MTGSTTFDITSVNKIKRFVYGGTHYIGVLTRLSSTAGTLANVTTTSADIASATVTLRLDVYVATTTSSTATDCARGAFRSCRFTWTSHLAGSYSGNESSPAVSDTVTLGAPSAVVAVTPPCGVPFSSFAGGTATITALPLHVCNVTSGTPC